MTTHPSLVRRTAQVAGGLFCGLLLAEIGFGIRDHWAFPHINVYVPDAELAVRLAPNTSQRIRFGGNPASRFTTHSKGYRGEEWPQSATDEVLIVGDSQVFGLGVDDDQTVASHLSTQLGRTVLNGGVPTYGPAEYLAVADEILCQRPQVTDLVVVLNMGNDLFEQQRPNTDRHTVWDGWAIRAENTPESSVQFPFRQTLMTQSHLIFGMRKLWYDLQEDTIRGVPSEGGLADLLVTSGTQPPMDPPQQAIQAPMEHPVQAEQQPVQEQQRVPEPAIQQQVQQRSSQGTILEVLEDARRRGGEIDPELLERLNVRAPQADAALEAIRHRSSVGDIVYVEYGESSRAVHVTAELLELGARIRRQQRIGVLPVAPGSRVGMEPGTLALAGSTQPLQPLSAPPVSIVSQTIRDAVALATTHEVRLTIVTLPLDVHVLPSQFAKYDAEPIDVSGAHALMEEIGREVETLGHIWVHPLEALAETGDTAWLNRDLHLSSLGQSVLATTIASGLQRGPLPRAGADYPSGRGRLPTEAEFFESGEIIVRGSSKNRCGTYRVREWFYAECYTLPDDAIRGLTLTDGPLETQAILDGHGVRIWIPLLNRPASIDVFWANRQERLSLTYDSGDPTLAFVDLPPGDPTPGTALSTDPNITLYGSLASPCANSPDPVDCLQGTRSQLLTCDPDQDWAGSQWLCADRCSPTVPCEQGQCTPWSEGSVCL